MGMAWPRNVAATQQSRKLELSALCARWGRELAPVFIEAGTHLNVRYNTHAGNSHAMMEVYEFIKGLGIKYFDIEIAPIKQWVFNEDIQEIHQAELSALFEAYWHRRFADDLVIREFPVPTFSACQAYTPYNIKVTGDGKLATCDSFKNPVSSIAELGTDAGKYPEIFAQFANFTPFESEQCRSCTNVGICGGEYFCKDDPCDFLPYSMDAFLRFFADHYSQKPHLFVGLPSLDSNEETLATAFR
jgi:radical SAM protein with 4Fe4S-binding SPASM domain